MIRCPVFGSDGFTHFFHQSHHIMQTADDKSRLDKFRSQAVTDRHLDQVKGGSADAVIVTDVVDS